MSDRRPPEDPWSEVLDQVEHALSDAGITDEPDRAALLDGVRDALDSLVGMDTRDDDGPDVMVVEGGRGAGEPPTEGDAPPLRVADASAPEAPWPEEDWETPPATPGSWSGEGQAPWAEDWVEPPEGWGDGPHVVLHVPPAAPAGPFPTLGAQGRFRLAPDDAVQTLFVGPIARAYRVGCAAGALVVGVDGGMEVRVRPGCSVDLEARQITIRADGGDPALGRYVRLAMERP